MTILHYQISHGNVYILTKSPSKINFISEDNIYFG